MGERREKFDEVIHEAEKKFRHGVKVINDWGTQARDVIQKQPATVLAGVAILGFLTGLLLRRVSTRESR